MRWASWKSVRKYIQTGYATRYWRDRDYDEIMYRWKHLGKEFNPNGRLLEYCRYRFQMYPEIPQYHYGD
jgi:hypothetical protein